MKYSFVLPAYKAAYLKEAIDSILNQTYKEFELIIVNDASPEGVDAIVRSYDDPRIQYYVNAENIGGKDLVAQWNYSITYAKGTYLILASDDDVYMPEYLEKMNTLVDKYPQVNAFRPRVKRVLDSGTILEVDGFTQEHMTKLEYFYAWSRQWIGSGIPFFIFKREALMEIGGFVNYPMAWFSDDATVMKLADNGIVVYGQETLFAFRHSYKNISSARNSKKVLSAKLKATKMFYDEHINFINNYAPKNKEEFHLIFVLRWAFKRLIKKNKVRGQFKASSLGAILSCMKESIAISCISPLYVIRCCKYPIIYSIRNLFRK